MAISSDMRQLSPVYIVDIITQLDYIVGERQLVVYQYVPYIIRHWGRGRLTALGEGSIDWQITLEYTLDDFFADFAINRVVI